MKSPNELQDESGGEFQGEFSFRSREKALQRFRRESFDLLVIGGGITGAATAKDAASRGLKVALVEQSDFAYGTSSRSSKLIHGGLRYLEKFELGLVFESITERTFLLDAMPEMVRPLGFLWPIYRGGPFKQWMLSLGLWVYDLFSLFRTPGFHKKLSAAELLRRVPFLQKDGLVGGFRYFDASMWDDALTMMTLRDAHKMGAAVASYVRAVEPRWDKDGKFVVGFGIQDMLSSHEPDFDISAKQVVICAGPWTDELGKKLAPKWRQWLNPSKGVHLVFDAKKIPLTDAVVMNHEGDGRVAFVIPRADFGTGVAIVGTTDGPSHPDPAQTEIEPADVQYLLALLNEYFPDLKLVSSDILSAYVGVRPLMGAQVEKDIGPDSGKSGNPCNPSNNKDLQSVSREHHIGEGPGGVILVAGGKYTTHRKMAKEIVDFILKLRKREAEKGRLPPHSAPHSFMPKPKSQLLLKTSLGPAAPVEPVNVEPVNGAALPNELIKRYGKDGAKEIMKIHSESVANDNRQYQLQADPEGFPFLAAQLRYSIRMELVMKLEDFYFRRLPLYLARSDHGMPWGEILSKVWAEEFGLDYQAAENEYRRLCGEVAARSAWQTKLL